MLYVSYWFLSLNYFSLCLAKCSMKNPNYGPKEMNSEKLVAHASFFSMVCARVSSTFHPLVTIIGHWVSTCDTTL